jgi:hypothetical protein
MSQSSLPSNVAGLDREPFTLNRNLWPSGIWRLVSLDIDIEHHILGWGLCARGLRLTWAHGVQRRILDQILEFQERRLR